MDSEADECRCRYKRGLGDPDPPLQEEGKRDDSDRARMQPAEDAELIDTTDLEVDDVVGQIQALIRSRSLAPS